MLQSQSHVTESRHSSPSSPSPQRRDNWFGDNEVESESAAHGELDEEEYRRYRAAAIAHKIHRQVATKLCPAALFETPDRGMFWDVSCPEAKTLMRFFASGERLEDWTWPDEIPESDPLAMHHENERIELTEPILMEPLEQETEHRIIEYGDRGHRTRLNEEHGYPTGPHLADVPFETFRAEVEIVLQSAVERMDLLESDAAELERDAMRMKRSQDYSDEQALATILDEIYAATEN